MLFVVFGYSCSTPNQKKTIIESCYDLKPLTVKKHHVQPGEWRDSYNETHESIESYITKNPPRTTVDKTKLYVLKVGSFDKRGNEIFSIAKDYLRAFFQIHIEEIDSIQINIIPNHYKRIGNFGVQINSQYLIDSVLPTLLPNDAVSLLAFSLYDLYPDDTWNFCFGQASLQKRVGVWSLSRFGNYNDNESSFKLCLRRTLNTAVHETGHMFGITHCVRNECCMNGSISLAESDQQPSWFCYECTGKICWNRNMYPQQHARAMLNFYSKKMNDSICLEYYSNVIRTLN